MKEKKFHQGEGMGGSWESLMESIEYCKTIADDPTKWEPYDDFKERLYQDFPWLK